MKYYPHFSNTVQLKASTLWLSKQPASAMLKPPRKQGVKMSSGCHPFNPAVTSAASTCSADKLRPADTAEPGLMYITASMPPVHAVLSDASSPVPKARLTPGPGRLGHPQNHPTVSWPC